MDDAVLALDRVILEIDVDRTYSSYLDQTNRSN